MSEIVVLSASDLRAVMRLGDYIDVVVEAFRLYTEGQATVPAPLHLPAADGGFHVKAAAAAGYAAFKINANFPQNRQRAGLPTIQGAVLLFDAACGTPLALLDSIEITSQRTAAATAVAARYLARADSAVATICGCGEQGRMQLRALKDTLPLRKVFAWDADAAGAATYAARMSDELRLEVEPSLDLRQALLASDVIAACTTARRPYLQPDFVRAGTFIAAVGADNPEKSELSPDLLARAKVVTDITAQAVEMGDLNHAIKAGAMTAADVHAELGELITGRRPGRSSDEEITIFDSTGTGIQDVAAARRAYDLARQTGGGLRIRLV